MMNPLVSSVGPIPAVLDNPTSNMKTGLFNVVMMGVCFALTLTAYQTAAFFVPKILKDIGYSKELGSFSLATVQVTLAMVQFVTPNIIRKLGPRMAMRLGCSTYTLFVASLIYVKPALLIAGSALLGVGASLFWNGQGIFLTQNSDRTNRGFHGGLFWSIQQTCLVWGSIIAYIVVPGRDDDVELSTARKLFLILCVVAAIGLTFLFPLREPAKDSVPFEEPSAYLASQDFLGEGLLLDGEEDLLAQPAQIQDEVAVNPHGSLSEQSPWEYMKDTFRLVRHPCLLPLGPLFIFGGLSMSFWQGTYGTIVGGGYEDLLPRPLPEKFKTSLITYVMIAFGASEVSGALFFGWLCDKAGRVVSMATSLFFLLVFVGLTIANFIAVDHWGLWSGEPSVAVALVAAGFLGLSDSAVNTIIYSIIGRVFSGSAPSNRNNLQQELSLAEEEEPAVHGHGGGGGSQLDHAYAFHFLFRASAGAGAYYYAPVLDLSVQLALMSGVCFLALVCLIWVERRIRRPY